MARWSVSLMNREWDLLQCLWCGLFHGLWSEPLPPVVLEVAGSWLIRVGKPREIVPGDIGATMMIEIPFPVKKNPTEEPVVPEVPGSVDNIALGKGMTDVLSCGPVD